MYFISELEDASDLCRLNTQPLTREDAIMVAALAGMKNRGGVQSGETNISRHHKGDIQVQCGGNGGAPRPPTSRGYRMVRRAGNASS